MQTRCIRNPFAIRNMPSGTGGRGDTPVATTVRRSRMPRILTNGRNQRFINSVESSSLEGQNSILFAINQVDFALTAGGE